jgi:DNA ligase-1
VKRLAAGLDRARASRSRIAKEQAIGDALALIAGDDDDTALATAARLAAGRAFPVGDGRALGVGWSLMLDVVRGATGLDDEVISACVRVAGELAEAFALLVRRIGGAESRAGLALREVGVLFDAVAAEPARASKRALLDSALSRATPLETKYLCKALGGGMRIGAQESLVVGAVARAFGAEIERVRRAAALVTDVGELAVLARRGKLDEASLVVGRPVAFMLATPIETMAAPIEPAGFVVEDKIDGVRAQVHRRADGEVAVFARGLDRTTTAFPEVVKALAGTASAASPVVLDGEIVAVAPSGRPRPFQALQPRLKKTQPSPADLEATRVAFVAFDLLADGDGSALARPWRERRVRLESFVGGLGEAGAPTAIVVNPSSTLPAEVPLADALDAAFAAARARGQEGLVLKRTDSPYDAGRRGQSWIKVKRAHATLDAVVVAAEEGHGRRAGVLSDYTFAVWRGEELVPIGKAYSGLADDEIDTMTRRLEAITLEHRGGLRVVRPEIVLEVAFDGIQRSKRHASGFALRFPRIVRMRDDKRPEDADRIEEVEALFAAQVASGHREQESAAGEGAAGRGRARAGGRKKERKPKRQLSLFGDDES